VEKCINPDKYSPISMENSNITVRGDCQYGRAA